MSPDPVAQQALGSYGPAFRRFNAAINASMGIALALLLLVAAPARAEVPKILALGDSLTAGYGLAPEEAFPVRLEAKLRATGTPVTVINAGVSGDTSAGGRARLDWALADKPDHAIVALGANDMLRGVDPTETRRNLDAILADLKARGVKVLLLGMLASPNMGKDYGAAFDAIYPDLAKKHGVTLYPFFLDGVAAQRDLNQADGIHPNTRGVAVMVERIAPVVRKWLATP